MAEVDIEIPIAFITGHVDIPMSVRAMKAGAVEFVTKPFRDQELLDAIREAIQRIGKCGSGKEKLRSRYTDTNH